MNMDFEDLSKSGRDWQPKLVQRYLQITANLCCYQ